MRARVLVSVAVAATIALGATGCEFMTPQDTVNIKQIADGVEVNVGKVDVRNAALISAKGQNARFTGTLINNTASDKTVTIQVKGQEQTVDVPGNGHVDLGAKPDQESATNSTETGSGEQQGTTADDSAQQVQFDDVNVKPGSLVKVYFSYGSQGASVAVPVLTGQQEEYQHLVPTKSSTPEPSSEITLPVETPSASATPSN